ncbi:MAG TPA: KR domain-containing protein, partial [Candidatus Angelobacter sp.]|nr:KR domain-containing protein [Candidatus Angelobacter sp.]
FRYFVADVSNPDETTSGLRKIETEIGTVTAVLHGAGVNYPKRMEEITGADLHHTFAPKLTGLRNILDHIDPEKLHLLVTFGSIIARTGLHGEAHYGMANDRLKKMVEHWQKEHPACRCLNLEWSVWAGAGMGQRLGVLDSLIRQGITPLPLDDAIHILKTILRWKEAPVSCIVTSRFGNLSTLHLPEHDLPLRRFLEHTQVHYPGIELIADAELSIDTDPYVSEHVFQGEQLLPAVCGMEAMAQVAMALEETDQVPQFEHLRFDHPIVIPGSKSVRIRTAALRRRPGVVSVVIRCATTSFQVDHFSGECVFNKKVQAPEFPASMDKAELALDPSRDLYGRILFHQGRFRRVEKYVHLQAQRSVAELWPPAVSPWYARHLPSDFVAGDAASRDAALHSIQACIPHKTILPVGVERIIASAQWTYGKATVQAIERLRDGDNFIYDLKIQDACGQDCEYWQGLHLRAVARAHIPTCWPLPLLGPYMERKVGELAPFNTLKVLLSRSASDKPIARQIIGTQAELTHRPDGKPEILGAPDIHVSISHSGCIALMVSANCSVGCDLDEIHDRSRDEWEQLLGKEGVALAEVLAERSQASITVAATQVWTLKESLRKIGASFDQSFCLESVDPDRWTKLSGGRFAAVTFRASIAEPEAAEYAFSFVIEKPQ